MLTAEAGGRFTIWSYALRSGFNWCVRVGFCCGSGVGLCALGCDLRCGGFRVTIECALGREFTTWIEVVVWTVLGCWFVMLV